MSEVKCENCNHCKYITGNGLINCERYRMFLFSRPQFCRGYQDDDTIRIECFGEIYRKIFKNDK